MNHQENYFNDSWNIFLPFPYYQLAFDVKVSATFIYEKIICLTQKFVFDFFMCKFLFVCENNTLQKLIFNLIDETYMISD